MLKFNQKINDNWGGSMELLEDKVEYKIYHCQKEDFSRYLFPCS